MKVFIVYHKTESGKTYGYMCKTLQIAEEKAKQIHHEHCISYYFNDLANDDFIKKHKHEIGNEDFNIEHTYDECKNKDARIWIESENILLENDIMFEF